MTTTTYPRCKAKKPRGGFIFLTVQQLCLLWWAYRTRLIQLIDLRIWFAAQEMVARRCEIAPGQVPVYTPKELHELVGGVGGEHLRAAVRRLEARGLLTWSATALTFAATPSDLRGIEDLADFHAMYNTITNNRRRVPVPRQAIRLIAGGLKTSVIAAMLGHMLRCLYYRDRCCISGGWCKASWIAEVFHVDLRNVKAARKHLVAIGWLQMLDTPQVLSNRFGSYTIIRLSWTRASVPHKAVDTAQPPVGQSPPPPEFSTTGLPPLILHSEPLQEHQHQKPAVQADQPAPLPQHTDPASGVQGQGKHTTDKATPQAPTLWHIVPDDLRDTGRLLVLFEQAHTQGWIGKSESNRLTFVATAEHARVIGSTNPCGLFAELIRRKCWHYVTESDEDAAHRRLKAHLYGADHQTRGSPQPHDLTPPALSKDAAIVHYLQTQLARAGFAEDIFGLMSRDDASWTRERWDNAVGELDQARRIWHQGNVRNRLGDLTELGDPLGSLVATTSACAHSSAA